MRHLAIRFKSGVTCAYPSTTESDFDGLVVAVSAGMWVRQYVYGVPYVMGVPGTVIETRGVMSQSGWVQEAILYDDAPIPWRQTRPPNPHAPTPIVKVRPAQKGSGFKDETITDEEVR